MAGPEKQSEFVHSIVHRVRRKGKSRERAKPFRADCRVYVASRASVPARPEMWKKFRAEGMLITSTWIDEAGEGETADFSELWQRIGNEISASDGLILYAKAEDLPLKGALIEVGIAIGLRKPVAIVLDGFEPEGRTARPIGSWIAHPLCERCESVYLAYESIRLRAHLA